MGVDVLAAVAIPCVAGTSGTTDAGPVLAKRVC